MFLRHLNNYRELKEHFLSWRYYEEVTSVQASSEKTNVTSALHPSPVEASFQVLKDDSYECAFCFTRHLL
jgi:hypothetical protein